MNASGVGENAASLSSARRFLSCPPARSEGVVLDAGRGEQPIREARPGIEELRLVEVDQKGGIETYVFARARRRLNSREGEPPVQGFVDDRVRSLLLQDGSLVSDPRRPPDRNVHVAGPFLGRNSMSTHQGG